MLLMTGTRAQQTAAEPADFPEFQVGFDPATIATSFVSYTDGTAELRGYMAYENTSTVARPGVVIIPDYDGN